MPTFAYIARDGSGRAQRGSVESGSASELASELRSRGWVVLSVSASRAATGGADFAARARRALELPPGGVDVELSLQQLAVMLRSGLTLLSALRTVAEQSRRRSMGRVWALVAERIQEGMNLGDAVAEHRCFPPLVVRLIRVGEQTGNLEEVLDRAAVSIAASRRMRGSLVTALIYPVIVTVAALAVAGVVAFYLVPKMEAFLDSLGRDLPAMTQLLVDLSRGARAHWFTGFVVFAFVIGAIAALRRYPPGKMAMDRAGLRVPIIGGLLRMAATASFSRNMSVLVRSGITLLEALRTTEGLLGNAYLSSRVSSARQSVMEGATLAEPLSTRDAFLPMLSRMIAVGEAAGTLDDVLEEVADFHESQLAASIKRFSTIAEPVIILFVGGVVGFVYISFFMALFAAYGGR